MPKKSSQAESFPTTPAGFGINNTRIIVCAMDGTEYPHNKRVAYCVGCNGASFWAPNYAPNYCLSIRKENLLIQCSSCKMVSIIPAGELIRVEKE